MKPPAEIIQLMKINAFSKFFNNPAKIIAMIFAGLALTSCSRNAIVQNSAPVEQNMDETIGTTPRTNSSKNVGAADTEGGIKADNKTKMSYANFLKTFKVPTTTEFMSEDIESWASMSAGDLTDRFTARKNGLTIIFDLYSQKINVTPKNPKFQVRYDKILSKWNEILSGRTVEYQFMFKYIKGKDGKETLGLDRPHAKKAIAAYNKTVEDLLKLYYDMGLVES